MTALTDDEILLKKRLLELARKSEGGYFLFSDFLGLSEQAIFATVKSELRHGSYSTFGGAFGAERVMIRFGLEEELGYCEHFPISIIKIEPRSAKFAQALTHRDYLGSVLALGIERRLIGDIVIRDNEAYMFCKTDIAEYISDSLTKIKRTDVTAKITDTLPDGDLFRTERKRIQASGERIDAIVAKVFSISRDDSLSLFKKRLVFIDGRLCENNSATPKNGEIISVRGFGRFIYRGYETLSKKGKFNIDVDLYV
jgi:RNA-binding protein YlmH